MTVDTLLMVLGVFVATLPQLGFPRSWDEVFFFLAGITIVALGIIVRRRGAHLRTGLNTTESYIETAHRHEELAQ